MGGCSTCLVDLDEALRVRMPGRAPPGHHHADEAGRDDGDAGEHHREVHVAALVIAPGAVGLVADGVGLRNVDVIMCVGEYEYFIAYVNDFFGMFFLLLFQ